MDIYWYIKHYNFTNFDVKNAVNVRKALEYDFLSDVGNVVDYPDFKRYKKAIENLLSKLDVFKKLSKGKFDSNRAWRILFILNILPIGKKYFPTRCNDTSFFNLVDILEKGKPKERPHQKQQKQKPKPQQPKSAKEEAMHFMNLKTGFTLAELRRKFRKLCLTLHPDKGGDAETFIKMKSHYDLLKKKFS